MPQHSRSHSFARHRRFCFALLVATLTACASGRHGPPDQAANPCVAPDGPYNGQVFCANAADCGKPGGNAGSNQGNARPPARLGNNLALQQRLTDTARQINFTPQQQVLWDRYLGELAALIYDQNKTAVISTGTDAAKQIAHARNQSRNRFTALENVADALDELYSTLDAKQKKIADSMLPLIMPALYASTGETASSSFGDSDRGSRDSSGSNGSGRSGGWGSGRRGSSGGF